MSLAFAHDAPAPEDDTGASPLPRLTIPQMRDMAESLLYRSAALEGDRLVLRPVYLTMDERDALSSLVIFLTRLSLVQQEVARLLQKGRQFFQRGRQ